MVHSSQGLLNVTESDSDLGAVSFHIMLLCGANEEQLQCTSIERKGIANIASYAWAKDSPNP